MEINSVKFIDSNCQKAIHFFIHFSTFQVRHYARFVTMAVQLEADGVDVRVLDVVFKRGLFARPYSLVGASLRSGRDTNSTLPLLLCMVAELRLIFSVWKVLRLTSK